MQSAGHIYRERELARCATTMGRERARAHRVTAAAAAYYVLLMFCVCAVDEDAESTRDTMMMTKKKWPSQVYVAFFLPFILCCVCVCCC